MSMDEYKIGRIIGKSSFGKVHVAVNTRTGKKAAVKMIEKSNLSPKVRQKLENEITALKELKHPSIVRLYGHSTTRNHVCILMEYLHGGDVATKLKQLGHVSEAVAWKYFRQLIGAVSFFHSKGITHRDLKPQNLLLDSHGNLKVADFGLCATSDNGALHSVYGTPGFMAPELLTCKDGDLHSAYGTPCFMETQVLTSKDGYDGASVDVYSCGVILYLVLAGHMPIAQTSPAEYLRQAQTADFRFPAWFSEEVKDLIGSILEPDPKKRLTIPQIEGTCWYQKGPESSTAPTTRPEASRTPTMRPECCRRHSKSPGLLKKIASTVVSSIICSGSHRPDHKYCCGCKKYHDRKYFRNRKSF